MNPLTLTLREIFHRWKTSLLVALIVAAITGALAYFAVNNSGYQREVTRGARDIGSNVVILPAAVDQFQYHADGEFSDVTMQGSLVNDQLEHKASLNHLIPILDRRTGFSHGERSTAARVVGIAASTHMPGRPKAKMQKTIDQGKVQLGSSLEEKLGVGRDDNSEIQINGQSFTVGRVNSAIGTWQDACAFLNLDDTQSLFDLPGKISRIEAIECASEQCELTGKKPDVVLANELAAVTGDALIFRREKMADARSKIRVVSRENPGLLKNMLWDCWFCRSSVWPVSMRTSGRRRLGCCRRSGMDRDQ